MRTLCIGDIHGGYKALIQCLERSKFDYNEDRLICLGDVADGWSEVARCFDKLLEIPNLIYILGNHDHWLLQWFKFGEAPSIWTRQGGSASIASYAGTEDMSKHETLLNKANYYWVDEQNRLYVHGGLDWHNSINKQNPSDIIWDRHLFQVATMWEQYNKREVPGKELRIVKDYLEVFIGHTATEYYDRTLKPVHVSNIWNLDQGAGWNGKLSIMDVDTKEFWQSDIVSELYPNELSRK